MGRHDAESGRIVAKHARSIHDASMLVPIHTLLGMTALGTGAANLLLPKGTRLHRIIGFAYVLTLGATILSSFFTYDLFQGFGPFHAMALVSGATLVLAIYFPLFRRDNAGWIIHHYMWI